MIDLKDQNDFLDKIILILHFFFLLLFRTFVQNSQICLHKIYILSLVFRTVLRDYLVDGKIPYVISIMSNKTDACEC